VSALDAARAALPGAQEVWVVGGAVRDRLRGVESTDVDLVTGADPGRIARRVAGHARVPAFPLSAEFGVWRVVHPDWRVDVTPVRGTLADDLALRDFTVNAMAEPLHGGALVDPHGGAQDLAAGRLRAVGAGAFTDDPLRVVRLARFAVTLGLAADAATTALARAAAPGLARVAGERVFAELRLMLTPDGIERLRDAGALAVVLPEIDALRGVEQTVYHHKDAYGHTLEVLEHALDPPALLPGAAGIAELMGEPLADGLTRGDALRWGALLHDSAKPPTQTPNPKGGFGFPGHQTLGAETARAVLTRLRASERLRAHVADLTRHHLRLGYLVHRQPLTPHDVYAYLVECTPVTADVSLLTVCDRRATRGRKSEEAIAKHVALARELWPTVLAWQRHGPPRPLLRGDELGLPPGPEVGRVLAELQEAQFAGEVASRADAEAFVASRV
jgi:tRNA nucleotidyltransferase/poly(A) polymerase